MTKSLLHLSAGQRSIIREIDGEGELLQRLMEMGLLEGEEVELIRFAPLGDPLEVRVRGYHLSLRRSEAEAVLLEDETTKKTCRLSEG